MTVSGTNLSGATAVAFGSALASGFSCQATTCTVSSPPHQAATVEVTVTTSTGTSATSADDRFTYVASPPPPLSSQCPAVSGSDHAPVSVATKESTSGQLAKGDVLSVSFDQAVGLSDSYSLTLTDGTHSATLDQSNSTIVPNQACTALAYTVTGAPTLVNGSAPSLADLEILSETGVPTAWEPGTCP